VTEKIVTEKTVTEETVMKEIVMEEIVMEEVRTEEVRTEVVNQAQVGCRHQPVSSTCLIVSKPSVGAIFSPFQRNQKAMYVRERRMLSMEGKSFKSHLIKKTLTWNSVESSTNVLNSTAMLGRGSATADREFLLSGLQHRDLECGTCVQNNVECKNISIRDVDEIVAEISHLDHGQGMSLMPMERYLSEVGYWTPLCVGERKISNVAVATAHVPTRPSEDVDVYGRGRR
jgi:hypothetical protein